MYANYQFAIYNADCDTVEVSISTNMVLVISCAVYNVTVILIMTAILFIYIDLLKKARLLMPNLPCKKMDHRIMLMQ